MQDAVIGLPGQQFSGLGDDPGIGRAALGDIPVRVDLPGLGSARLVSRLLGEDIRQQVDGFDITAGPALVRYRNDANTGLGPPIRRCEVEPFAGQHDGRGDRLFREGMIAAGLAAGNL